MRVVSAPGGMDGPDLSVGEGEPRYSDMQQGGRVRTGPALSSFTYVRTYGERSPLWYRSLPQCPAKSKISWASCGIGNAITQSPTA